jgi:hypothetical protein
MDRASVEARFIYRNAITADMSAAQSSRDTPTLRINVDRGDQRRPAAELALTLIV